MAIDPAKVSARSDEISPAGYREPDRSEQDKAPLILTNARPLDKNGRAFKKKISP
jgi:hypothetical protein